MTLPQDQSRVTLQATLLDSLNGKSSKIALSLNNAAAVEAFFINEIEFPPSVDQQYQEATALSDSYEQSYETTQLQFMKTRLQIQNVLNTINLLKQQFLFAVEQAYAQTFSNAITTDLTNQQYAEAEISAQQGLRRIWTVPFQPFSITTRLG